MNCWQYPECGLHSSYLESFLGIVNFIDDVNGTAMSEENM